MGVCSFNLYGRCDFAAYMCIKEVVLANQMYSEAAAHYNIHGG